MAGDELTPTESAILVVLMAEAREVLNKDLKERYGLDVKKPQRDKLTSLKYISSRPSGRTIALQLEDQGWIRAQEEFEFRVRGATAAGAALTALLTNLRDRIMPRSGYANFVELFALTDMRAAGAPARDAEPARDAGPVASPARDIRPRVVAAYEALAGEPGAFVSLRRLRPFFADLPREALDEALTGLSREDGVNLVPESNQRTLTAADVDAALRLGGQDIHLLAVGV